MSKELHKRQTPLLRMGRKARNGFDQGYGDQVNFCVDVSKWSDVYFKIIEKPICKTEFKKQCIDRSEEVSQLLTPM